MRFIADASLAGLARWLRVCGYDTVVFQGEAGRAMMRQALAGRRILLTRRRDMLERQFPGRIVLMPVADAGRQLKYVVEKLSLEVRREKMLSLCLLCNELLEPLAREEVCDLVPPHVFENHEKFNRCRLCGRIYWEGSHIDRVFNFLEKNDIRIV